MPSVVHNLHHLSRCNAKKYCISLHSARPSHPTYPTPKPSHHSRPEAPSKPPAAPAPLSRVHLQRSIGQMRNCPYSVEHEKAISATLISTSDVRPLMGVRVVRNRCIRYGPVVCSQPAPLTAKPTPIRSSMEWHASSCGHHSLPEVASSCGGMPSGRPVRISRR